MLFLRHLSELCALRLALTRQLGREWASHVSQCLFVLPASSNHCVCSLHHYRSKQKRSLNVPLDLAAFHKGGDIVIGALKEALLPMSPLLHLSFRVGRTLSLCTCHLLGMDIFSFPLVKSSRFTSSEKPSLTTSVLGVCLPMCPVPGCGLIETRTHGF